MRKKVVKGRFGVNLLPMAVGEAILNAELVDIFMWISSRLGQSLNSFFSMVCDADALSILVLCVYIRTQTLSVYA